jgi:hypothetical protein
VQMGVAADCRRCRSRKLHHCAHTRIPSPLDNHE